MVDAKNAQLNQLRRRVAALLALVERCESLLSDGAMTRRSPMERQDLVADLRKELAS